MSKKSISPQLQAQIDASMQRALQLHQTGQFQQAAQLYQQILQVSPKHAGANHYLGVISHQTGDNPRAEKLIRKALLADPKLVQAYNNLGVVLKAQNKLVEAQKNYQKVLRIKPDYADAHSNLGMILHELGDTKAAIPHLEKAIELNPQQVDALNALGIVYRADGQTDKAIESYQRTIKVNPKYADAYNNLGTLYASLRKHDEAITSFKKAIEIKPNYAGAHANLGNVYLQEGLQDLAEQSFQKALNLNPDNTDFLLNLGLTEHHRANYQAAFDIYQKVLERQPGHYLTHSSMLLLMNYSDAFSNQEIFEQHKAWERTASRSLAKNKPSPRKSIKVEDRRIRIGYLSADFRQHSVYYFFEPLLRAHNKDEFETFCYYNANAQDQCTERLQELSEHWRDVASLDDVALVRQIHKDKIDILVDLSGHTSGYRLSAFMYRPAPVQITWLGYPNTTGLSEMDYRISDAIADPAPESDALHTENMIRLPNGFLCYQGDASLPYYAEPPFAKKGYITFGSFNNLSKVNDVVIETWAKILNSVPDSRLIMKCKQLADEDTQAKLLTKFEAYGIAADRVQLKSIVPSFADHLALYKDVDIGLDTFPYNGTTTTFEALWMGVPTLTYKGDRHAARVGTSIMSHLGLEDFVAESQEDYIAKAIKLAEHKEQLIPVRQALRTTLAESALCNAPLFAKEMENAFKHAIEQKQIAR